MKKFVFVNANGEPKHTSTPSDETVFTVGKVYGELVCYEVPIDVSDTEIIAQWYWKDGQAKIRPITPGVEYSWNNITEIWEFDLPRARKEKWEIIKANRQDCEYGGFEWNGYVFDSDALSQTKINGAVQLAMISASTGQPYSVTWTLKNNTSIVLSGPDIISVGRKLGDHVSWCYSTARTLRESIDNATTKIDLDLIVWPTPPGGA